MTDLPPLGLYVHWPYCARICPYCDFNVALDKRAGEAEALQKIQDEYADRGFTVLGFPCNQFGGQDPGDDEQIAGFCQQNYGVTFPMFSKIDVNGDDAHPLYKWLRQEKGGLLGSKIKWNFTKFLIGRDGEVIKRYAPTTKPDALGGDIEKALA